MSDFKFIKEQNKKANDLLSDKNRTLLTLKQVCLDEFKINRFVKNGNHYYGGHLSGIYWSAIYYIEKGAMEFSTSDKTIVVNAGEMIFIPKGYRFSEKSVYCEQIVYYIVNFSFHRQNEKILDEKFDITPFNKQVSLKGKAFLEKAFPLFEGDERDNLMAAAEFYLFFADIYPDFAPLQPTTFSSVLTSALNYIHEHYKENFTMEQLAAHCCASQSRIFHLFQEELKTTPVSYKNKLRIKESFGYLTATDMSVEEIAEILNFNSAANFRKAFHKITDSTPTKYRKIFNPSLQKNK